MINEYYLSFHKCFFLSKNIEYNSNIAINIRKKLKNVFESNKNIYIINFYVGFIVIRMKFLGTLRQICFQGYLFFENWFRLIQTNCDVMYLFFPSYICAFMPLFKDSIKISHFVLLKDCLIFQDVNFLSRRPDLMFFLGACILQKHLYRKIMFSFSC